MSKNRDLAHDLPKRFCFMRKNVDKKTFKIFEMAGNAHSWPKIPKWKLLRKSSRGETYYLRRFPPRGETYYLRRFPPQESTKHVIKHPNTFNTFNTLNTPNTKAHSKGDGDCDAAIAAAAAAITHVRSLSQ